MSFQSHTPASIVHLEKIGQIALTVTDLARARDFYQHTLGMRFLFDAGPMSFFQCGDIRFALGTGEAGRPAAEPFFTSRWKTSRPFTPTWLPRASISSSPRIWWPACPTTTSGSHFSMIPIGMSSAL